MIKEKTRMRRIVASCLLFCLSAYAEGAWAEGEASSSEAPSSEAAPSESPSPAAEVVVDQGPEALEMRALEEKVSDLKERIFRSKARLILLKETVLAGVISGAKAVILHKNEMGSAFVLEQLSYALDGQPLFNQTDKKGGLDEREEIELFNGSINPGNHNLSVFMLYRGNGYGVFSYLKGYTFKIKSSHAFTAEEGKITSVTVVAYEKGDFTTDLKDRPSVRYDVEIKQNLETVKKAEPAAEAKEE